jgi:hypothetical protein
MAEGRGKFGNGFCNGCNGCNGCQEEGRRKKKKGFSYRRERSQKQSTAYISAIKKRTS